METRDMKQPKAIYFLFTIEMWERFNYYGMRALLVLFMVKFLMFNTEKAGGLYGWFTGLVYLTPLIGGYIADRYWGRIKSMYVGMCTMAAGQFLLSSVAWTSSMSSFYMALLLIVIGNGFFKPNMSATVGSLYDGANDPRRDGGFTIFYMGVNLGAFIAPLVCSPLVEAYGWAWGFMAAAVGMVIGTVTLFLGRKKFLGDNGMVAANCKIKDGKKVCNEPLTTIEKQRIAVIFILMFFVIFFWSAFEQAGSSLTLFADQSLDRTINIFGWTYTVPTAMFQSLNPFFIVLFGPVFSKLWVKLSTAKMEPSTVHKFVWGLSLLALGFVLMVFAVLTYEKSGPVTMLWLIAVYLFHTLGELCLSPVGSSMVTKLAPARFVSMLIGVYFLANFAANLLGGLFAGNYDAMNHKLFFMIPVATASGAAILLLILSRPIRKWMHGVH
ncbi:MAG TPA: peptide MFS transporter [bacterium]|nr:peptide MFS transporter [bacterium]